MKVYLKGGVLFVVIMLFFGGLIWDHYHTSYSERIKIREAAFHSAYASIRQSFRLVSQTIFEEVLQQPKILELVHTIATNEGEQRNYARGLLYRELAPLYDRASQHSIQQLHFHFPNNHSMLRFNMPQKSDDDLTPFRPSVTKVNQQHDQVHGYESGRIVTGFRHIYPLTYQGQHIGSVELSHSFQQLRYLLNDYAPDSSFQFIMRKTDLWRKLLPGQQLLYVPSPLHDDYLSENRKSSLYQHFVGAERENALDELLRRLRDHPEVQAGIEAGASFHVVELLGGVMHSVLFHPIKNIEGQHAAFILSIHPEHHLLSLRLNAFEHLVISMLFAFVLVLFRIKTVKHRNEKEATAAFMQTVTHYIGDGLYTTDREGCITFFNPEAEQLLGYQCSAVIGLNAHDLFHSQDLQHQQTGCVILNTINNNETYQQQQAVFVNKNKGKFTVELTCTPIRKKDETVGTATLFRDITKRNRQEQALEHAQAELKQANLRLETLSRIDGLTGIANRREFDSSMTRLWKAASRRGEPLALLMIDIDLFKAYNDTYGHVQGDECLRRVATVIKGNCLRPEDLVARYGGEEFAVLLANTPADDARRVAKRICRAMEQEHISHAGSLQLKVVTISIGGYCAYPKDGEAAESLIVEADKHLYLAKKSGRNRVCFGQQDREPIDQPDQ